MINSSTISWRFLKVWRRNLVTYQKIWKVNFITPLLEPLLYILAFGLGFSGLVEGVDYAGQSLTYTQFIAPALIATAVMWNAFFETTYADIPLESFFEFTNPASTIPETPQLENTNNKLLSNEELEQFIDDLLDNPDLEITPPDALMSITYQWKGDNLGQISAMAKTYNPPAKHKDTLNP